MQRLVIGSSKNGGAFRRVAIVRLSNNGRGSVAKKLQGSHYSYFARHAASQFAKCDALTYLDYQVGSEKVRISK